MFNNSNKTILTVLKIFKNDAGNVTYLNIKNLLI